MIKKIFLVIFLTVIGIAIYKLNFKYYSFNQNLKNDGITADLINDKGKLYAVVEEKDKSSGFNIKILEAKQTGSTVEIKYYKSKVTSNNKALIKDTIRVYTNNPDKSYTIKLVNLSNIKIIDGLVRVKDIDDNFSIDIRYATTNNFTGKKIYTSSVCLLNIDTAVKLISANNEFNLYGYRIKIFDAYRPKSAQQKLWDNCSNKKFLSNPKTGSVHSRGAAADITLVDNNDKELEMPGNYDEFSKRSYITYNGASKTAIKNRELLAKVMIENGFKRIKTEWWHFDNKDYKKYPLLDTKFELFSE